MIESIPSFLRYFDAVNRRAERDIAALPPEAGNWRPATGEGAPAIGEDERAWSINTLIGHLASSRIYFINAYRGDGWISPDPPDVSRRELWLGALHESAIVARTLLEDTPQDWLQRRIPMIDTDGTLAGWRLLMMMLEHDIHHRSQIDTYAGINGWDVPDIYGRAAETILKLQPQQRAKHAQGEPDVS